MQWELLWYSAPTSLNNDLLNDGVILEVVNVFFFKKKKIFTHTNANNLLLESAEVDADDLHRRMGLEA